MEFPFPFEPYDAQRDFMQELYSVLQNQKVGIFESPTGTGKSLSIICGSLKWLKDYQEKQKEDFQALCADTADEGSDDWFSSFLEKQNKMHQLQDAKEEYQHIADREKRIEKLKTDLKSTKKSSTNMFHPAAKRKKISTDCDQTSDDDDEYIIDDPVEDDLLNKKEEKKHITKIYYASRTHSQLAQFLGEIKRSPFRDQITVTTLGSRGNFCVNDKILKLRNVNLINEQCIDLQRKKASANKCCPYLKNSSDLQNEILVSVLDIEEIVSLGRELKSCPYYATRHSIADVEVVLLPYNTLLHKSTRDAYGIQVKNNVIIIDEAHNLVEAVNGMYSAEISKVVIQQTFWQVDAYHRCFKTRLSRDNLRFLKQLWSILNSILQCLKNNHVKDASKIMTVDEFLNLAGITHVNLFELLKCCETNLFCQKVHGFTMSRVAKGLTPSDDVNKAIDEPKKSGISALLSQIKQTEKNKPEPMEVETKAVPYNPSAIFSFVEFLKTLTFPSRDGRVLVSFGTSLENSSLKFLHLNPASHFQDIVKEARSVILAGGTMQPISEFTDQLFIPAGISQEDISVFSCGHVIPPENLLVVGLTNGPCGNLFDFTYKSRRLPETVRELSSTLLNICNAVRGGIVCFFPSYDYEEFIFSELTKSKMIHSIEKRHRVFREPKLSSNVDKVLSEYSKCVSMSCSGVSKNTSGAILFSIVGGKMSEGINFSDDLGRCVVMVGLPYPNKFSVELKEKMAYLNQHQLSTSSKKAGDVYYNNLCMKAVNQSIGRAIRHRNDYACIVLLDHRYKNSVVKDYLPNWISKSLHFHEKFGLGYMAIRKFFSTKTK